MPSSSVTCAAMIPPFLIAYWKISFSCSLIGTLSAVSRHFNGIQTIENTLLKKICALHLSSTNIDSKIHFAADKFWLPQTGSLYFSNNTRNAAAPMFDQIHVGKCMGKSLVTNLRILLLHTLQCLSHGNLSRSSDFQPIIIDCNLCVALIEIATVHHSINTPNRLSSFIIFKTSSTIVLEFSFSDLYECWFSISIPRSHI